MPELVQKLGENISVGDSKMIEAPVVGSYTHTNGKIGVLVGLDTGSSDSAKDVAMHAAAMNPEYISPDDVADHIIVKEKEIWTEQLAAEGKPAEIMEKIMEGKEKKFREENALMKQEFVKNPEQSIEQFLDGATVVEYVRLAV